MTQFRLDDLDSETLLRRYVEVGITQDDAIDRRQNGRFRRLFKDMVEIEGELKGRAGDQRTLLGSLYDHPNMQVRLNAAKATLAVMPAEAREQLERIRASGHFPQAGDAGMSIRALDEGIFKPE